MSVAESIPTFSASGLTVVGAPPMPPPERDPERIGGLDRDPRIVRRHEKTRAYRLKRHDNAVQQIGRLPEPGEDIVLILTGNWHGWDAVEAILKLAEPATIEECYVATLGFNKTQTQHLAELIDEGRVNSFSMIVSQMFTEKNAAEYDHLDQTLRERGMRLAATRNHAKLMLFELSDGRRIVTHGSLNLRRCNSFEQMVITQDETLYGFFREFIDEMLNGEVQP